MRAINVVLALLLLIYTPLILLAGAAGVYSHFFGGILVIIVILFKGRFIKAMKGSGYKGYILFVVGFDFIWETVFYIGGYTMIPGASYFEIILINLIGWFILGTVFYSLAVKWDYSSTKALIVPAIFGIVVENVFRVGMFSPGVSLALVIVNGVNYSVELGFAYLFVEGYRDGKANAWRYIFGSIILYIVFWAMYSLVAPMYGG